MGSIMKTEKDMVTEYRAANPTSRIAGIIKYVRNGAGVKQRGCAICGAEGPTWSGKWPKTVAAIKWEAEHVASHLAAK